MPRYLIHRTFAGALAIPANAAGAAFCRAVVAENARLGVTWLHSFVSADRETMVCIYEGPSEAAIRASADRNGLPIDHLIPVTILDPHFYTGTNEHTTLGGSTGG